MDATVEEEGYWERRRKAERPAMKWFRDYCLTTFGLEGHECERQLMGILGEALYSSYRDDMGRVILPRTLVRAAVGKGYYGKGKADKAMVAEEWLHLFRDRVEAVEPSSRVVILPHHHPSGLARRLTLDLPLEFARTARRHGELIAMSKTKQGQVGLRSGKRFTVKEIDEEEAMSYLDTLCASIPEEHPAAEFARYLNNQSPAALKKCVKRNWQEMVEWVVGLPDDTKEDNERALRLVSHLLTLKDTDLVHRYSHSERSPRLWARGPSPAHLPRELREIAFQDLHKRDLAACQLAIAANLFECRQLHDFLAGGGAFWREMADWCKVDHDDYKPLFKKALYAGEFDAKILTVEEILSSGAYARWHTDPSTGQSHRVVEWQHDRGGLGEEGKDRFLGHPFMVEFFEGREKLNRKIEADEEVLTDAFGYEIPRFTKPGKNGPRLAHRTIMAYLMQSYELSLVLAAYEAVKDNRRVQVVCFLHDGLYFEIQDREREGRFLGRIEEGVRAKAKEMGIPTWLE